MRWLVENFTRPGDLVLDPFAGRGTTLEAARDVGRRAIGVEIDARWCAEADLRLAQRLLFNEDHLNGLPPSPRRGEVSGGEATPVSPERPGGAPFSALTQEDR